MNPTTQTPPQANNPITNDYLVTTQVNPSTLPADLVSSDLDAIKAAETSMQDKSSNQTLNAPPKARPKPKLDPNIPQELQALQLKNPFKGI
ncbi:hypothetical protein IT417_00300 [bacterium]|nr:hypothetical protein [bacterium]